MTFLLPANDWVPILSTSQTSILGFNSTNVCPTKKNNVSVVGREEGYMVKYTPWAEGVPGGEAQGNSWRWRGIFDRISWIDHDTPTFRGNLTHIVWFRTYFNWLFYKTPGQRQWIWSSKSWRREMHVLKTIFIVLVLVSQEIISWSMLGTTPRGQITCISIVFPRRPPRSCWWINCKPDGAAALC